MLKERAPLAGRSSPAGKSAELDDLTIASSELCQRALTMNVPHRRAGNTCYDYFESTETTATA